MAYPSQTDLHSRLVFWLKILLPLGSLGILSTLFLFSNQVRPEDAIPYADVDIATRIKEPRLTSPVFAGVTADGAAITLQAAEARVGTGPQAGLISDLLGKLETPDGASTQLSAKSAYMDQDTREAVLQGGVVLSNSAGYRVETKGIRLALDRTSLDTDGAITATGPVGQISAGGLHLGLAGDVGGGYVLLFTDGVRLIYLPVNEGPGNKGSDK
jgi:lipopolysaccharide export system protein LptC